MAFNAKTGSFTKNTGTGNQSVTGLGGTPKVLIMWTAYNTTSSDPPTINNDYSVAWGMTTGASESYSTSISSQYNVGTSNRSKRAAAKALTVVQYGETTLAECDLVSFDADGFTVDWTTNSGGAQIIHYLALWGSDITGQKVFTWTSPTLTGNKSVTGAGFKPNLLVFARPVSTSSLPVSATGADLALSFIDASGNSTSLNVGGDDGVANPDHKTFRTLKTANSTILTNTSATTREASTWVSMDTDGFTLNYTTANAADLVGCLAIQGPRVKVGNSLINPANVTGVGFTPAGLIFSTIQSTDTNLRLDSRLSMGATTGATENQTILIVDDRSSSTGGNTNASSVDDTDQAIGFITTGPLEYAGDLKLTSFDSDGFTMDAASGQWTGFVALGPAPTITTNAATDLTPTSSRLNGTVNPKGSSATYYFEYGLTSSYGSTTSTQNSSGSDDLAFNVNVSGLTNGTTYHYRAVVTATGVTIYGSDQTFTTPLGDLAVSFF